MNTGISAEEACRMRVLSEEDFASTCNKDGSLKYQPGTTTSTLKDDPSKAVAIDNTFLYAIGITLAIGIVCLLAFCVKYIVKKVKAKPIK